jgi:hypothetical protein
LYLPLTQGRKDQIIFKVNDIILGYFFELYQNILTKTYRKGFQEILIRFDKFILISKPVHDGGFE